MLKILFKVVKGILISSFLLYAYNLIVQPIGCTIPINYFTIGSITILGIPALFSFIFIMIFIY